MCYNSDVQSNDKEKDAARRAAHQMKTAALVISLSFVLVLVLVAVLMIVGHVKIF
jgi:flagellar biogenesis protein FliO